MIPVFDGHNDTLLDLYLDRSGTGRSFLKRSDVGHIDLPRAVEGGFGGGFFAVFPPSGQSLDAVDKQRTDTDRGYEVPLAPPINQVEALQHTMAITASLFRLEKASQGRVKVVRTAEELEACLMSGTIAIVLHFEGAEAIGTDLSALEVFYRAGLRSLGIVWSRPNAFGTGVPFSFPASPDIGPGLTEAGRELIKTCNGLGIMIDLSHLNERGFWDVAELSNAPLVATHSNAHALCPTPRNLTDEQLAAIKDSRGMVGLNFAVGFLREDGQRNPDVPLEVLVKHIDYLIARVGIDHVGLGSDFDGAMIPQVIGDVSGLQRLIEALRTHGYDEISLQKIAHLNWLGVLKRTWKT
ncbi:MAG: dipeptidase [Trueperaceae bacterium]|nr:MAG: dipeptidase [Trueperaceae bacterium]